MARLQDDNVVIDFVDDTAETQFTDDLGNVTFGTDIFPVFPLMLMLRLRLHAAWLLFMLIPS